MGQLRIGTCSWKYPSWRGLVYSDAPDINFLQEYASRFNTVEVDQWFWSLFGKDSVRLPSPVDARAYRQSVPDDFLFSIKAPDSLTLTHLRKKSRGDKQEPLQANPHFFSPALFRAFLDSIEPLHDVLGPVMLQFEYLNRQKMPGQAEFQAATAGFLRELPAGHSYALEIRNPNYLNAAYFRWLANTGAAPVLLQGYYMPSIVDLYRRLRDSILLHETVIIRLHGPDRQGIEEMTGGAWDHLAAPKDQELADIAEIARELLAAKRRVYINVNNHYEGSAPLTIARLRPLIEK